MQPGDISARVRSLAELMEQHLGVRAANLTVALRRGGRRLPRGLRRKVALLLEAESMADHPKLRHRIDAGAIVQAYEDVALHLRSVDLRETRRTRALNILAGLALNLLIAALLFVLLLRWRGFL